MRKVLIALLVVLIVGLAVSVVLNGISLGTFQILSVSQIQGKNDELDKAIAEAKEITELKYPSEYNNLNTSLKTLIAEREKYERELAQSDPKTIEEALKKEKYEIETLWISIGNYAEKNDVVVNMQVVAESNGIDKLNNLNFTVNGSYQNITQFVYDIEDDEQLRFKIEDFNLVPATGGDEATSSIGTNLKATFSVKYLYINIDNAKKSNKSSTTVDEEQTSDEPITEEKNEKPN